MEDIVLAIIKGAYKINDLHIDKIDSATMKIIPFINADETGIAVEWNSLLKGKFVGEPGFFALPASIEAHANSYGGTESENETWSSVKISHF
jgi:hypothetical protein